jgi:hypothetical protein
MDNTPDSSQPVPGRAQKRSRAPVIKRAKVTERDPVTNRFVKTGDGDERRRLSVEARERGVSLTVIAANWWSGDSSTALREIKRWYAEHPSEDVLTTRRIVGGKLANLEEIVRAAMEKEHYVVGQRGIVLDAEGKPLVDDKPIYDGVAAILKINDQLMKIVPGLAAPKVTAEISGDAIEAAIAKAEADLAAELAALGEEEEGGDDA